MPQALFTTTVRNNIALPELFAAAELIETSNEEETYRMGDCVVTLRYRIQPGDFVCKQNLGCRNAIITGQLICRDQEQAVRMVLQTQTIFGVIGPDVQVEQLVAELGRLFSGVIVTGTEAIVVE